MNTKPSMTSPSYFVHVSYPDTVSNSELAHLQRGVMLKARTYGMAWDPFESAFIHRNAYKTNMFVRELKSIGITAEPRIE